MRVVEPVGSPVDAGVPALGRVRAWAAVHRWTLTLWGGMAVWSAVLFAVVRSDYLGFRLARFDLGNMTQAVWSTAHGRPLDVTSPAGEEMARLGLHVDPMLALLAPAWLVAPSPLTLAAVQIVALALGALPVFWLGRRHLGSDKLAGLLALAFLAYPWLSWNAVDAVHPVTMAIPLLLFAVYFLDGRRPLAAVPFILLALTAGELMGVVVTAVGLWYLLARRGRWWGAVYTAAGVMWTLFAIYVIVPAFSGESSPFFGYYASVGGSPLGVVKTVFTDPGAILSALFTSRDVAYVLALSAPLAGLFVLAPGLAAVALPQFLANGLSISRPMTDAHHHYSAAIVPFLVAATVLGIARLPAARRVFAVKLVFALSVALSFAVGAWPFALQDNHFWYAAKVEQDRVEALHRAVALVPDGAPVSATNKVGSQFSARRYFYSVPLIGRARWIVVDENDPFVLPFVGSPILEPHPALLRRFERRIEHDPAWTRVFNDQGVVVFRKGAA